MDKERSRQIISQRHTLALLSTLRVLQGNDIVSGAVAAAPLALVVRLWEGLGIQPLHSLLTLGSLVQRKHLSVCHADGTTWTIVDTLGEILDSLTSTRQQSIVPKLEMRRMANLQSEDTADPLRSGSASPDLPSSFAFGGTTGVFGEDMGDNRAVALLSKYRAKLDLIMDGVADQGSRETYFELYYDPSATNTEEGLSGMSFDDLDMTNVFVALNVTQFERAVKETPSTISLASTPVPVRSIAATLSSVVSNDPKAATKDQQESVDVVNSGVGSDILLVSYLATLSDESLHQKVVDAYESMFAKPGDYAMGPRDNYFFRHFELHVKKAKSPTAFMSLHWRLALLLNTEEELWNGFSAQMTDGGEFQELFLPPDESATNAVGAAALESTPSRAAETPGLKSTSAQQLLDNVGTIPDHISVSDDSTAGEELKEPQESTVQFFEARSSLIAYKLNARRKKQQHADNAAARAAAAQDKEADHAAAQSRFLSAMGMRKSEATKSFMMDDEVSTLLNNNRRPSLSPAESRASSRAGPSNASDKSATTSTSTMQHRQSRQEVAELLGNKRHNWHVPSAEYQFHCLLCMAAEAVPDFGTAVESILSARPTAQLARLLIATCLPDMIDCRRAVTDCLIGTASQFLDLLCDHNPHSLQEVDEVRYRMARCHDTISILQRTMMLELDTAATEDEQLQQKCMDTMFRLNLELTKRRNGAVDHLLQHVRRVLNQGHPILAPVDMLRNRYVQFVTDFKYGNDASTFVARSWESLALCHCSTRIIEHDSELAASLHRVQHTSRLAAVRCMADVALTRASVDCATSIAEDLNALPQAFAKDCLRTFYLLDRQKDDVDPAVLAKMMVQLGARLGGDESDDVRATWHLLPPCLYNALSGDHNDGCKTKPKAAALEQWIAQKGVPKALQEVSCVVDSGYGMVATLRDTEGEHRALCDATAWEQHLPSLLNGKKMSPFQVMKLATHLATIHAHLNEHKSSSLVKVTPPPENLFSVDVCLSMVEAITTQRCTNPGVAKDLVETTDFLCVELEAMAARTSGRFYAAIIKALFMFIQSVDINRGTTANVWCSIRLLQCILDSFTQLWTVNMASVASVSEVLAQFEETLWIGFLGKMTVASIAAVEPNSPLHAFPPTHGKENSAVDLLSSTMGTLAHIMAGTSTAFCASRIVECTRHGIDECAVNLDGVWCTAWCRPLLEALQKDLLCPASDSFGSDAWFADSRWNLLSMLPTNDRYLYSVIKADTVRLVVSALFANEDLLTKTEDQHPLVSYFQRLRFGSATVSFVFQHTKFYSSEQESQSGTRGETIFNARHRAIRSCLALLPRGDGACNCLSQDMVTTIAKTAIVDRHHPASSDIALRYVSEVLMHRAAHVKVVKKFEDTFGPVDGVPAEATFAL